VSGLFRLCEHSEAIQSRAHYALLDCFATLAMTGQKNRARFRLIRSSGGSPAGGGTKIWPVMVS